MTKLRVALAAATFLLSACGSKTAPAPRLVLLYAPCTVNRALLAPYDATIPFTPNLTDFQKEALVFERHLTESGQSGIAYASLFTGGQADLHGVYAHPRHVPEDVTTITEVFQDAGYDTFFWGSQRMAVASLNGQGVAPANQFEKALSADDPVFTGILQRLADDPGYRAFIVTAFTVTHAPYKPHGFERFVKEYPNERSLFESYGTSFEELYRLYQENYIELSYDWEATIAQLGLSPAQSRDLRNLSSQLYRSRIRKLDSDFGRVVDRVDAAGFATDSIVAFTADHGEVMQRENALFRWTHGHALAPEVLSVPWILRGRNVRAGRYSGVSRSIDILPTLANLSGISLPPGFAATGEDLSPALGTDTAAAPELLGFAHTSLIPHGVGPDVFGPVFAGLYPRDDPALIWVAIYGRERVFKWRNHGDGSFVFEAFDHRSDPQEEINLYDPNDAEHVAMRGRLQDYKARLVADHERRRQAGDASLELPAGEDLEALKSLGYVR